jgi:hypothetical protein
MKFFKISWFTKNIWLKIIALILTVGIYFYIQKEIGESRVGRLNTQIKTVAVVPNIKGEPPSGYRIYKEGIRINPSKIAIAGTPDDLLKINKVYTEPIDVRKYTNTTSELVAIQPLTNIILVGGNSAVVEIPIIHE